MCAVFFCSVKSCAVVQGVDVGRQTGRVSITAMDGFGVVRVALREPGTRDASRGEMVLGLIFLPAVGR